MIPKSPAPKSPAPPLPPLTAQDGVVTVGDHTVTLTPAEWSILEYLRARAGETVTRDELTALLGGSGNIADVYICRLRNKIEKPLGRRMIRTVRGAGYTFCE
jgi:DNA-binding response OmpR family regulator